MNVFEVCGAIMLICVTAVTVSVAIWVISKMWEKPKKYVVTKDGVEER